MNLRGCSTLEGEREVICRKFLEQKLYVFALCETKLKWEGEYEFGCVNGRMSAVTKGKAREGVTLMMNLAVRQ